MEKTGQTLNEKFEAERFYLGEGPDAVAMVKASDYDNLLDAFLNNCGLDDLQVIETIASAAARRMYDRLETVTSNRWGKKIETLL